ncbi:related to dihydroflavonol-4-reductase [Cephalotrichum gorgonifer]|uniref:Related to dihydroflavonol-4-reductase n=1 Tax=Cephalotrichum gorgonifer TaxID=2041049 RepID=A0AAE8SXV9_9PEZI|nr:related to dihydroflavonol-4-reductase [Cephalotrichum gorgonifer]
MSTTGAFDEAVKGVQGVVHTASNVSFSPDPNAVIVPTVAGMMTLLQSASMESSIKGFVYTSSGIAAADFDLPLSVDTSTWNEAHIKEAWSVTSPPFPDGHGGAVYGASKTEAEKALWKYVKEENPHFRVNSILPDQTFGEVLSTGGSLSTGNWIRMVHKGEDDFVKHLRPAWYVNVKDVARLHVAALLSKSITNERIYACAAPFTWNQVLDVLRRLYPSRQLAEDIEGAKLSVLGYPTKRGEQLLQNTFGREGWSSLEETVAENVKDLA